MRTIVPPEGDNTIRNNHNARPAGSIVKTVARVAAAVCWFGVMLAAGLAFAVLVVGLTTTTNVMQQVTFISLSLAVVILPYCFARAVAEITKS